jgi:biotin transporter BioY
MLGFTVQLWVQGVLPDTTPDWLMLGNQVAIGGAFVFLLLTVWLAMHASVSAQGLQARLLTQMVRLPIPTWEEIEACRTYGSQFEKVEARQMFRIPFAMGPQEQLVKCH